MEKFALGEDRSQESEFISRHSTKITPQPISQNTFLRKLVVLTDGKEEVTFDYKYFQQKRKDILDYSLQRILYGKDLVKENLKCFIRLQDTEIGWYSAARTGQTYYSKEISITPILLSELENVMTNYRGDKPKTMEDFERWKN